MSPSSDSPVIIAIQLVGLWRHPLPTMVWNAYHAPEILKLHTTANFEVINLNFF